MGAGGESQQKVTGIPRTTRREVPREQLWTREQPGQIGADGGSRKDVLGRTVKLIKKGKKKKKERAVAGLNSLSVISEL